MMKEICVKCNKQLKVVKVGVNVVERAEFGDYRLWAADLLECPNCKHQVVSRFAERPQIEHYDDNFEDVLSELSKKGEILCDF